MISEHPTSCSLEKLMRRVQAFFEFVRDRTRFKSRRKNESFFWKFMNEKDTSSWNVSQLEFKKLIAGSFQSFLTRFP